MIFVPKPVHKNNCRYYVNVSVKTTMTILAIVVSHCHVSSKSIKYNCTNPDDFFYAVPGSRCRFYYRCTAANQLTTIECQPESIFDFYKQSCTREEGICYEPVCTGKVDGMYQDTTHVCRRSYVCYGGIIDSIDNCPKTQLHNGRTCETQNKVFCEPARTTSIAYPFRGDQRCTGLLDGKHVADNTNCSRFITCDKEKVISDIECAEYYRYHDAMGQCVPKHLLLECKKNDHKLCNTLNNGYHADPTSDNCQNYIYCRDGRFIKRENCGNLAIFNGLMCVPNVLYQCPNKFTDICHNKLDGLIGDPRKNCRSYVKCSAGKTIEQFECPVFYVFDPQRKLCMTEISQENGHCHWQMDLKECTQLEMGYYQDISRESSCKNYYFCYNGIRTNYRCHSGTVFNGEHCVNEDSYTCPNQNSCLSKNDGYYKDSTAGCRTYFYCSGGQKFRYLCNVNQYFNGSVCIEKPPNFKCPNNSKKCIGKFNGYYADLDSLCRKYYYCAQNEILTTFTCTGSKVYNGQKCIQPNEYACPVNTIAAALNCIQRKDYSTECTNKTGFYADIDSECTKYYFCIGNNKTMLQCQDGYVFNGDLCVPQHQYTCPKYCNEIT